MSENNVDRYDLAIILKNKITEQQLNLIGVLLKEKGFQIFQHKTYSKYFILLRFDKLSDIIKEAERLSIQKEKLPNTENKPTETIKLALNRTLKRNLDLINPKIIKYENYECISPSNLHKFIDNCPKTLEDLDSTSAHLKQNIMNIFSSSELVRIKYLLIKKLRLFDLNIYDFLNNQKFLIGLHPLYENDKILANLNSIEKVFGEKVALYFTFMKTYIKWLFFPAFFGIINFVLKKIFIDPLSFIIIDYLYSIVIILWFTFFLIFWQRKQSELNVKYGSYGKIFQIADKNNYFKAQEQLSLITGLPEERYSKKKRLFWYFLSFIEAMPFLLLGISLKIFYLTLKGFIIPGEFFYFDTVGYIINEYNVKNIIQMHILVDIFQIFLTSKINSIYTGVCFRSTQRENHRTNQSFENSYALKRFCFVFLNRFIHLGYIAFIKVDFEFLLHELNIIFILDEVRRVIVESLLPLFMKIIKRKQNNYMEKKEKDKKNPYIIEKIAELQLENYENFDDYLEITIQVCYLVLFSGVFPQASYLSLIFNIIEYYSDNFKLTYKCYKRPLPLKANSIGCWFWLLNIFSFCCIFSNTFIFAFNLYQYFLLNQKKNDDDLSCIIWNNILIAILASEHLILALTLLIRYLISLQPKWVRIFHKRRTRKKIE